MASILADMFRHENLLKIWNECRADLSRSSSGIDSRSVDQINHEIHSYINQLINRATHQPSMDGLLGIAIPKPNSKKYRIICVPTYGDRLIQYTIQDHLRLRLGELGLQNNISFGVVRGGAYGVESARARACEYRTISQWVYKSDIISFFDAIPRDQIKAKANKALRRPSLNKLISAVIDTEIVRGSGPDWNKILQASSIKFGVGLRQGMPLSPMLSSLYLSAFDRILEGKGIKAIRYVDDLIAFFDNESQWLAFHNFVSDYLNKLELTIGQPNHEGSKTGIYSPDEPAEFLGMELTTVDQGRCKLLVPDSVFESAISRIVSLSDIDYLNSKHINISRLGRHIDSVANGLVHAFRAAHNIADFNRAVRASSANQLESVLSNIFGQNTLGSLSPAKRRFLCLS